MEINKGKITCRQAMLLIPTMLYPGTIWWYPYSTATDAKQAGWLATIPAFLIFYYLLRQINYLVSQNKNLSLLECFERYTNKIIGKLFATLLLIYLFVYSIMLVRYRSDGLLGSIYPNVKSEFFIIAILLIVNIVLKYGIVIVARMNEILVVILTTIFLLIIVLTVPNISIDKITPISYLDIIPIVKSSIPILDYLGPALIIIFVLSDKISNKQDFIKNGKRVALAYLIILTLILIGGGGVYGHYLLSNMPTFLTLIKQLKILGVIYGLESIIIPTMIISQVVVLSLLTLSLLRVIQYLFNIKHNTLFINILLIFYYVFNELYGKNIYLANDFYSKYIAILEHMIAFLPIVIVWIARIKLKRKNYKNIN